MFCGLASSTTSSMKQHNEHPPHCRPMRVERWVISASVSVTMGSPRPGFRHHRHMPALFLAVPAHAPSRPPAHVAHNIRSDDNAPVAALVRLEHDAGGEV